MTLAFIGMGANLHQPLVQLMTAHYYLNQKPDLQVERISSVYPNVAVSPETQPDYYNAVACLSTSLSAHQLLERLLEIENHMGRIRHKRWGARNIDLDLLVYDRPSVCLESEKLHLPHPRLRDRLFVLVPWVEIEPNYPLPDGTIIHTLITQEEQDAFKQNRLKLW